MDAVALQHVEKSYTSYSSEIVITGQTRQSRTRQVLRDLSVRFPIGQLTVIVGRSGCGKSTLLRQCKPALSQHGEKSGAIYFNGKAIEELSFREQSEKIGFVMQDPEMQEEYAATAAFKNIVGLSQNGVLWVFIW